ncbi:ATP-binding protein [Gimesia aquarii]|uniref:histidine kinase n=1 Tax=Gimesia aquarii TaxID=2527964 RepID=A0A517X028_9PLAN|nr:ATP-binding protein [Gimesia aquarii]QDU10862.1 Sensor histidine kinase TodS [Gimesia aquarii]
MHQRHMRVLLIEDDPVDHQLIKLNLSKSRSSFELVWTQFIDDGLAQLAETKFDVVLTDLSLPDSFGLGTIKRIRDHNQDVPIVVLTTLDDEEIRFVALTAGAQDYFVKDEASPQMLERAIHHAIQRQESVVEIQHLLAEVESSHALLTKQKELLKKKNRRLRKLNETAHRFVDNVSHEFRTPLTVIKDYVSLVREGVVGQVNEEQCRMLDVAGVRTDELNNMVDDMLDVSKLGAGLLGAWRRPCQLSEIVESVCPPLAKKAAVKKITFETNIDQNLPSIYCDSEKVGRVIINLVTNAIKFCGKPGIVRLWAEENHDQSELNIGITDNGPGIDDEGVSQIFKRFKQLKTQITNSTKGFGLGLNIAKELVDLNFGEMSVESELGQGTTFSFTIPLDNPSGIMKRYLEKAQRRNNGPSVVAFVRAQIEDNISDIDTQDMDSFFNYLLRANDLLFRVGTHEWVYALSISSLEMPNFVTRVETEWGKTNRNRPFGPLPFYKLNIEGTWDVTTDSAKIYRQFNRIMQKETVYA